MNNFIYLIPLHNKSRVIEQTVNLLKRKFYNSDISGQFIFIENGSTDDSLKKYYLSLKTILDLLSYHPKKDLERL